MSFQFYNRNTPFSIAVAGKSKIKLGAVEDVRNKLNLHASVTPILLSHSGQNEQPACFDEGMNGAATRAMSAYESDPRYDFYVGIENYIYEDKDNGEWYDFGAVFIYMPGYDSVSRTTDACQFPTDAVLATINKPGGFVDNTVGKTLAEMGLVRLHDDPHLDLMGLSRRQLIADAVEELFQYLINAYDVGSV
jgi:non-canonical (house-cleaning) NTP pyrophosphatase